VADRPRIEGEQHQADEHVREHEAPSGTRERRRQGRRERRHAEHRREDDEAVRQVVRVEAVGVEGEAHPGPPHGDEERKEAEEASRGDVEPQLAPELSDRDDEDEIEEELEPGGAPRLVVAERPQARRLAQAAE
jgi:hypothetical protein